MAITFHTENVKQPNIKKGITKKWITLVASDYNKTVGDIAYLFSDDKKTVQINQQYLNRDYFTDIITFDYSDGNKISGDIIISLDSVQTNSKKYHTDYQEELHRVIIHGILHLCGINDISESEKLAMREAENRALESLKLLSE